MIRHSNAGSAWVTALLLMLVVLAPLPFAGVLPRDRAALQIVAFLTLALAWIQRPSRSDLSAVSRPLIGLLAVAGLGVLQALPWPAFLARLLFPSGAAVWRRAAELQGLPAPGWIPLSVAPQVTLQTTLQWLAVAACLAAAALQARERGARRVLSWGLPVAVLVQVALGAESWLSRTGVIWGIEVPGDATRLRGTFVNSDHFAFFVGMSIPLAAAWLWWGARKSLDPRIRVDQRLLWVLAPFMLFAFCFAALAFSGSRAGLAAVIGGLFLQSLALALRYRRWWMVFVGLVALILGSAMVWSLAGSRGFGRLSETSAYELTWNSRSQVWLASSELVVRSPLVGTGLGTFRQAFPAIQPPHLPGSWRHVHSDILELAITCGLWTWLLLAWILAAVARRLWRVLNNGRRSEDRMLALGMIGVLGGAFLHSFMDFSLTMPANAYTLAALLGIVCGTPLLTRRKRPLNTVFLAEDASSEPLPRAPE